MGEQEKQAKEAQNQQQVDEYRALGPACLGIWTSYIWRHDPRHLCFLLARYKFVAKMLAGRHRVLEVGCGDAVGAPVVLQTVNELHGIDFEALVLADATSRTAQLPNLSLTVHDVVRDGPLPGPYDAAFSLDVIEHIAPDDEAAFLGNIVDSLVRQGVVIIGTPNVTSSAYASAASRAGHINLKSADSLRALLATRCENVFMFSMNDEVVHTGYYPMAHYLLGMGVGISGTHAGRKSSPRES